jgi:hypothetical protein
VSERLYRLLAIVRADVLVRMRRPSTAVIFVLLSAVPYIWIPDPSTGRALIQIDGHRALYNSGTIGMGTAMLGSMFIGLFGFYVISNALRRDVTSRCGYVIASTTMRGSEYLLGKFVGNVAFLSLFTAGYMTVAMAMVLVRGEAGLEPVVFATQYLLLMPSGIVFVSACAVLFECTPLLRTKFGDVLYFFLFIGLMGSVAAIGDQPDAPRWPEYFDVSGIGFLAQQMKETLGTTSLSVGSSTFDKTKAPIDFKGLQLQSSTILSRVASTLWPMALLLVARLFFHRFDPARLRAVPNETARRSWGGRLNLMARPFARLFVGVGGLLSRLPLPALMRAVLVDATAAISAFPLASIAVLGFAVASMTTSADSLLKGVMPAAFAAAAIVVADIACREKRAGTSALIFATPGLRNRYVIWKFGSTLAVASMLLALPVGRAIALQPSSTIALLVGVFFTAAAATALAIVSANPKTFIVGFLTFWYVIMNDQGKSPALDFAGWFGSTTPAVTIAYAAAALAALTLAQLYHMAELRRRW